MTTKRRKLGVLLFPEFEVLDVFGPLEMFGNLSPQIEVVMLAERKGLVKSSQGPRVQADWGIADCPPLEWLLVPGGQGTRTEVDNASLIAWLAKCVADTELAMTVCTGTAILARAGVLDRKRATTNKKSFAWVESQGPRVDWVRQARWVEDGKFFTSSGVSAGIDMALAVIEQKFGTETARALEEGTEYDRHRDARWDPFARIHGLV